MEAISEILGDLKESLKSELKNLKELKGEKLKTFIEIFNLEGEVLIFFNDFNIVFCDTLVYDQLKSYLHPTSLIVRVEIPEMNRNIWIHQYFNERIFNDYLE